MIVKYRKALRTVPALALKSYDAVTNKKLAQEHAQSPEMREHKQEICLIKNLLIDNQVLVAEVFQ